MHFFLRFRGTLETAPAIWAAQQLLEGTPSAAQMELAHALLRHALALEPWDRELATLANSLAAAMGRPPLPLPDAPPRAAIDTIVERHRDDLLALLRTDLPAPARHRILLSLWAAGQHPEVVATEAHTWARATPSSPNFGILAWAAHGLGATELRDLLLERAAPTCFWAENLRAAIAMLHGDAEAARRHLVASLRLEPAQPHAVEQLALLGEGLPALPQADATVHILFYTFNKLETTLRTLESVLATDIGDAAITLLNNGSTAFSPADLEAGVARVAQGRPVRCIHLPVNIGAPAARNWLWHLPEVQQARYVAFLDDDVLLPRHWLSRFLADLEAHPQYCAVGGKVVNPNAFHTIQYVYRYFQEVGEQHIRFTPNAPMFFDLGQYDVVRPCLSVMGCCHLFHRRRMERLGVPDFDVRFSPSQVDDLERDIQIWKHGGMVLYDGRVRIMHLQDAGSAAPKSEAAWAHVWGNHQKMEAKFRGQELRAIHARVQETEAKAWRTTLARTREFLPESARTFWTTQMKNASTSKQP